MRKALLLLFVVAILIGGGLLSFAISRQGADVIPGIRLQTTNPEANVAAVTPTKGALFFIYINLVLGGLISTGVMMAVAFWFLNRGVVRAHQQPNTGFEFTSLNPARHNTLGEVLTRHPGVTITLVIIVIATLAIGAALVTGFGR